MDFSKNWVQKGENGNDALDGVSKTLVFEKRVFALIMISFGKLWKFFAFGKNGNNNRADFFGKQTFSSFWKPYFQNWEGGKTPKIASFLANHTVENKPSIVQKTVDNWKFNPKVTPLKPIVKFSLIGPCRWISVTVVWNLLQFLWNHLFLRYNPLYRNFFGKRLVTLSGLFNKTRPQLFTYCKTTYVAQFHVK